MWATIVNFAETHRGLFYAVLTLVVLSLAYKLLTRVLRRYMKARAHKPENILQFLMLWRYLWLGAGLVFLIASFSGSLVGLGISAAFLGMILGWSLQAPVTGIAAWLMIVLKRPFSIGDRIIISGVIGDVTDINLTHIVLNQVGGTIGGEEKSGRGVMIPNATLFQQIIYNYAMETKYILDEVPIMITYESDLNEAKAIIIQAAREVTRQIVEEMKQEPFTRDELTDWGVRLRVRYLAVAVERQRTSSDIVDIILERVKKSDRVRFCYPHSEIIYRQKGMLEVQVTKQAGRED